MDPQLLMSAELLVDSCLFLSTLGINNAVALGSSVVTRSTSRSMDRAAVSLISLLIGSVLTISSWIGKDNKEERIVSQPKDKKEEFRKCWLIDRRLYRRSKITDELSLDIDSVLALFLLFLTLSMAHQSFLEAKLNGQPASRYILLSLCFMRQAVKIRIEEQKDSGSSVMHFS